MKTNLKRWLVGTTVVVGLSCSLGVAVEAGQIVDRCQSDVDCPGAMRCIINPATGAKECIIPVPGREDCDASKKGKCKMVVVTPDKTYREVIRNAVPRTGWVPD